MKGDLNVILQGREEDIEELVERGNLKFVLQEFSECGKIIDSINGKGNTCVFCRITNDPRLKSSITSHNCLGCNFLGELNCLQFFLARGVFMNEYYAFRGLISSMYFLSVKMMEVLKYINVSDEFLVEYFQTLVKVKRWMNFFKHPKYFTYAHHPKYLFENDPKFKTKVKGEKVLDYVNFIEKYYSGEDIQKNDQLRKKVANKKDIVIKLPDPKKFVTGFSDECKKFTELVLSNEYYISKLKEMSTKDNYYWNEETNNV